MNKIKFRQFINGDFHYWGIDVNGFAFSSPTSRGGKSVSNTPNDQFIGIKDKNNEEAYLGDIVKAKLVGLDGGQLGVYVGEIIFHEYELAIETPDSFFPVASWSLVESFEIIGNKYENPELLEKED